MRVGIRTLVSLALCAAAAGAALSHFAIDIVGDYALTHDSYDDLNHGSREVVTGLALVLALALVARGLRTCCEIAAVNRARVMRPFLGLRERLGMFAGASAGTVLIVPAMEYLDGCLDGIPVHRLSDAFGGSIFLGIATALVCAGVVAALVDAVARWLISHRDSIVTIIETLLRSTRGSIRPSGYDLVVQLFAPRRRRTLDALRLSKRGPPATSFV
jgi:hypothetical protein